MTAERPSEPGAALVEAVHSATVHAVRFRNVDVDLDAPVDTWPAEAIEIMLDRGSLSDWRRLSAAIRENPWGPAARTVENITRWGEHYGVDVLMAGVIRDARTSLDRAARQTQIARSYDADD